MNGWIKLHRSLLDWGWYDDRNTRDVWFHLLLKASFEDDIWHGIKIPRGSLITSREHLAEEIGISVQNVRTALNNLKSTNEITIKTTNKYTLITIENWAKYQDKDDELTNQITDKLTNNQPTTNHIVRNKEIKNITTCSKMEQDDRAEKEARNFEKLWELYPRKEDKQRAFTHYMQWVKGKKYLGQLVKLTAPDVDSAICEYTSYIKQNKIEPKYIKSGANFMSSDVYEWYLKAKKKQEEYWDKDFFNGYRDIPLSEEM